MLQGHRVKDRFRGLPKSYHILGDTLGMSFAVTELYFKPIISTQEIKVKKLKIKQKDNKQAQLSTSHSLQQERNPTDVKQRLTLNWGKFRALLLLLWWLVVFLSSPPVTFQFDGSLDLTTKALPSVPYSAQKVLLNLKKWNTYWNSACQRWPAMACSMTDTINSILTCYFPISETHGTTWSDPTGY